jgi:hypothetical protein
VWDDDDGPLSDQGLVSITVTSVNDAPEGVDNTVSGPVNGAIAFTPADFGFADPNDDPANAFSRVKITTLPGAGTLSVGVTPLNTGDFVTVADIANLQFAPAANVTGVPYANFTFQVEDDGGTANTGVNLDPEPKTMAIIVWKLTAATNCGFEGDTPEVTVSGNGVTLGVVRGDTSMPNCVHGASALLPPLEAGMTHYEVTFSYNLFSWDSYNAVDPEVTGTGHYDSFSVSVSTVPYEELELTDPITELPGLGFLWGGTNWADSLLECSPSTGPGTFGCGIGLSYEALPAATTFAVMPGNNGNNYLNVVLDTVTTPQSNHAHPSYGRIRILSVVQRPPAP